MALQIGRMSSRKVNVMVIPAICAALIAVFAGLLIQSQAANAEIDQSRLVFKNQTYYVDEGDKSDMAANIATVGIVQKVEFFLDGNTEQPLPGVPHANVSGEWRLNAAISAGEHVVTARVLVGTDWYAVNGSATIYSLDAPLFSYVRPDESTHVFRPSDNPVRVKIDDEFEQFNKAKFDLYAYDKDAEKFGAFQGSFTFERNDCDSRQAGRYLLCDLSKTEGWSALSSGTYAVKLTTHVQKTNSGVRPSTEGSSSLPFTVDGEIPRLQSFRITSPPTDVDHSISVEAKADDNTGIESVNFYVTAPREGGTCTGNGEKFTDSRVYAPNENGFYEATLNANFAPGRYCVTAVARDFAQGNSVLSSLSFDVEAYPTATIVVGGPSSIKLDGQVEVNITSDMEITGLRVFIVGGPELTDALQKTPNKNEWIVSYVPPHTGDYEIMATAQSAYGEAAVLESPYSFSVVPNPPSIRKTRQADSELQQVGADLARPFNQQALAVVTPVNAQQAAQDGQKTNPAVLGTETTKSDTATAGVTPIIAASDNGWKILGLAWYWWLLIVAVITAIVSWLNALRRRKQMA